MSPATLSDPAARPGAIRAPPLADSEIVGLTADSRQVRPGFLFAALRGAQQDGRAFAAEAVLKGAVAILTDDAAALNLEADARRRIAVIADPNPHRRLAQLAARFYPRQPRTIAAVTGTNGKTSVVHFTREIWAALGHPAASLGTLGLVSPAGRRPGGLAARSRRAGGARRRACGDRSVEPWSGAIPSRRCRGDRRGIHQSDP